jgi:hypothetical protein
MPTAREGAKCHHGHSRSSYKQFPHVLPLRRFQVLVRNGQLDESVTALAWSRAARQGSPPAASPALTRGGLMRHLAGIPRSSCAASTPGRLPPTLYEKVSVSGLA